MTNNPTPPFKAFKDSVILCSKQQPPSTIVLTTRVCQKNKSISDHFPLLVCFGSMISKNCPKKFDNFDHLSVFDLLRAKTAPKYGIFQN